MRPLVVLHGLFGSSRNWNSISKKLSVEIPGKTVYAVDLRNHGCFNNPKALAGPIESWKTFRNDLESYWKDNLAGQNFDLLGHSFGGQVAMSSVLTSESVLRSAVKKLIIVDISMRHPCANGPVQGNDKIYELMRKMLKINEAKTFIRSEVIAKLREVESDVNVINFLLLNLVKTDNGYAFSNLDVNNLILAHSMLKRTWKADFVPWNGETLFVKGENSDYVRSDDETEIKKFFPNSRIEIVSDMTGLKKYLGGLAPKISPVDGKMNTCDDLNDDVNYINGLFNNFGMEEFPFSKIFAENGPTTKFVMLENKARVCSLLIQLLHSKQKEEIFRKDSEDRITRLMDDIHNLEAHQKRQDERVKLQERDLIGHRQNQQLFIEKQRQMETVSNGLRDELTKLKQLHVQKERQFQHELRKREKEFEKLKDQLAAVLKDMQLREQKSEIHYNPHQTVRSNDNNDESGSVKAEEGEEFSMPSTVDRVIEIEGENDRLRQIISFTYGSLVQLVVDLFPELELDQSILSLLETSPMSWIEEQLAFKTEELFEILRDNLANLALQHQQSISKENEEVIIRLKSQLQAVNSTVSSQVTTIKALEQQLSQMEEYRAKIESLEIEKTRLQDLLNRSEKVQNENIGPGTPKWMKPHAPVTGQ